MSQLGWNLLQEMIDGSNPQQGSHSTVCRRCNSSSFFLTETFLFCFYLLLFMPVWLSYRHMRQQSRTCAPVSGCRCCHRSAKCRACARGEWLPSVSPGPQPCAIMNVSFINRPLRSFTAATPLLPPHPLSPHRSFCSPCWGRIICRTLGLSFTCRI